MKSKTKEVVTVKIFQYADLCLLRSARKKKACLLPGTLNKEINRGIPFKIFESCSKMAAEPEAEMVYGDDL